MLTPSGASAGAAASGAGGKTDSVAATIPGDAPAAGIVTGASVIPGAGPAPAATKPQPSKAAATTPTATTPTATPSPAATPASAPAASATPSARPADKSGQYRQYSPAAQATPGTRTQQAFISLVAPGAESAQQRWGVPAAVTIAQAIDESAWGNSQLAADYHNLFGIKGSGPAGSVGPADL